MEDRLAGFVIRATVYDGGATSRCHDITRRTGSHRMRKLAAWVAGLYLAALALYLPVWWALFFGGYFAPRLSPEVIALVTCFLPADVFALATFIGFVSGLWRRPSAWTHICGFAFCGSVIYFCLFAGCAIITGAFPGDLVMHLAVWPYLAAAVVMAWWLRAHFPRVTPGVVA
jgi:hypothetical protein